MKIGILDNSTKTTEKKGTQEKVSSGTKQNKSIGQGKKNANVWKKKKKEQWEGRISNSEGGKKKTRPNLDVTETRIEDTPRDSAQKRRRRGQSEGRMIQLNQ